MLTIVGGIVLGGIGLFLIFIFLESILKAGFVLAILGSGFGFILILIFLFEASSAYGILAIFLIVLGYVYREAGKSGQPNFTSSGTAGDILPVGRIEELNEDELNQEAGLLGITFVGGMYVYQTYRYEKLVDAINYAHLQAKKSKL